MLFVYNNLKINVFSYLNSNFMKKTQRSYSSFRAKTQQA
jgi:hypothetical protein